MRPEDVLVQLRVPKITNLRQWTSDGMGRRNSAKVFCWFLVVMRHRETVSLL